MELKNRGFGHNIKEWAQTIVIALIIALPIRFFIAEPFIVNGASMDPTFASGQFLIVDRLTYYFEEPERGDVVIFKYPSNPKIYYIKRIIGLPGETIRIKEGKITIIKADGQTELKLDEPYVGQAHKSYESVGQTLGPKEYFVMGDNRLQSSDSRSWGPLDRHFIVGRPIIRLLPIGAIGILPGEENVKK